MGAEKIVGQDTCLGKTTASLANFEVDPTVPIHTSEIVFLNELRRNVQDLDADVFRVGHESVEVDFFLVNGAELCTLPGDDAVEKEFDAFKGGCVGADIPGKANPGATNGDTGSVRVILLRLDFADNHGMTDLLALVEGGVLIVNDEEGVGTRYPLT